MKSGYPCRCWRRACPLYGHHFWRLKRPQDYIGSARRFGLCPKCRNLLVVNTYRKTIEHRRTLCRCGGYIGRDGSDMPHRRGSEFCVHGAAGMVGFRHVDSGRQEYMEWREQRYRNSCNP